MATEPVSTDTRARANSQSGRTTLPEGQSPGLRDVQVFLESLARYSTQGDRAAVAKLWESPALVVRDDRVTSIGPADETAPLLGGAQGDHARGVTGTRANIVDIAWPSPRVAIVRVDWPHLDGQGREIGRETSTYTLRRDDHGAFRIRVAVLHGEAKD